MAETSAIEWTDATWNPITGCTLVSEGCRHCYAAQLAATRLKNHPSRQGLARVNAAGEAKFTGEVRFNDQWIADPLRWKRPRRIFVCAHGDLFHEDVPDEWIDRVFAVMALAPQHTFQVLTKRTERMQKYVLGIDCDGARRFAVADAAEQIANNFSIWDGHGYRLWDGYAGKAWDMRVTRVLQNPPWPLPNVWLGTSIEDQATADSRIPDLLDTPAALRFVSAEPLLGPVDLTHIQDGVDDDFSDCGGHPDPHYPIDSVGWGRTDALTGYYWSTTQTPDGVVDRANEQVVIYQPTIDWVICGGESGPHARPMHPDWARSLRDQCSAAGVPFFFKQWGEWVSILDREQNDPDWRLDYSQRYADTQKTQRWLNLNGGSGFHGERFQVMARVGKKFSGNVLDGKIWNQMPTPRVQDPTHA